MLLPRIRRNFLILVLQKYILTILNTATLNSKINLFNSHVNLYFNAHYDNV